MSTDKQTVATPSRRYVECSQKWKMIDDLCGGTIAMREAREDWLPKEEKETGAQYEARLKRSFLYGALRDTIDNAVAKPFSQPVTLSEHPLAEKLARIENSVDRKGQSLTSFGAEVFKAALKYRYTYVIVDYPASRTDEEGNIIRRSVGEERSGDIRPYWVHVPPNSIIGMRKEVDDEGRETVTMMRIKSTHDEPDGEYGEKIVYRITVWTSTEVIIFEAPKDDGNEYREVGRRSHTYGEVPVAKLDLDADGDEDVSLPFEDLGWMNIAHWQSMSDQRTILRIARVPFILAAGFTREELGEDLTISAGRFYRSKNPDANMKHIEHTGKAIEAGENDLLRLEERMIIQGLQPFVQQTGTQTATGKAIDKGETHTQIQAWVRETESFLVTLYEISARWVGAKLHPDFSAAINNDFGFSINAVQDVANLIKARLQREITRKTFLHELKRRGFLAESVNVDNEIAELEEENPPPDFGDGMGDGLDPDPGETGDVGVGTGA